MSEPRKEATRDHVGYAIDTAMDWGMSPNQFLDLCSEEWEVRRFDRTKREDRQWKHALRPEAPDAR